jgi:hypothetical protein
MFQQGFTEEIQKKFVFGKGKHSFTDAATEE